MRSRLYHASIYALRHLGISLVIAAIAAALVFGLLYPAPYRALLGVGAIFLLLLAVDVVSGPLLTLILASPTKSRREGWVDFGLVGLIQLGALVYGLHSVWAARPVLLAFETDRLVVVTANEIDTTSLSLAPENMRKLPVYGVLKAGTRRSKDADEMMESLGLELLGAPIATRPDWWVPWNDQIADIRRRAKPLTELFVHRPKDADVLRNAVHATDVDVNQLFYLPLTGSKTKEWVALLDEGMNMVGWAPVDGFVPVDGSVK